jgi:hypothetical protein
LTYILRNSHPPPEDILVTYAFYCLNTGIDHLAQFEGGSTTVLLPSKVKKLAIDLYAIF